MRLPFVQFCVYINVNCEYRLCYCIRIINVQNKGYAYIYVCIYVYTILIPLCI